MFHSKLSHLLFLTFVLSVVPKLSLACWQEAGARHGVDPYLLMAVAQVESGGRAQAVNNTHKEKTGSTDIGLMQINSRWLPQLAKSGYTEMHLKDACSSIHIGAWLLGTLIDKHGDAWEAIGAYNAACTQLKGVACTNARSVYAWKVFRAKEQLIKNTLELKVKT